MAIENGNQYSCEWSIGKIINKVGTG